MTRPKTLTAAFCRTISKPGTYGDGRGGFGLALRVKRTRNGRLSRAWAQRVVIGGKPTYLGLGSYPTVTLAEARRRALTNRREIEAGRDPRGGGIPTFQRATDQVIALHRDGWKGGQPNQVRVAQRVQPPRLPEALEFPPVAGRVAGCVTEWWSGAVSPSGSGGNGQRRIMGGAAPAPELPLPTLYSLVPSPLGWTSSRNSKANSGRHRGCSGMWYIF